MVVKTKGDLPLTALFHFLLDEFPLLVFGHFPVDFPGCNPEFVPGHDQKIAVGDSVKNLLIGQVQRLHERCDLSENRVIPYDLGFAIRLLTFLCKADSLVKFPGSMRDSPFTSPSITSSIGASRKAS